MKTNEHAMKENWVRVEKQKVIHECDFCGGYKTNETSISGSIRFANFKIIRRNGEVVNFCADCYANALAEALKNAKK